MDTFKNAGNILVVLCERAAMDDQARSVAESVLLHPAFCPNDFDRETFNKLINAIRHNDRLWSCFVNRFPIETRKCDQSGLKILTSLVLPLVGTGTLGYFLTRK